MTLTRPTLVAALFTAFALGAPALTAAGGGDHHPEAFPPPDRPLRAGFLVVDGVYNSELMAPYDVLHHTVFHTAGRDGGPGIEVFTVSPDGRPVTTFEGLHLTPHHSFETAPPLDILVVPSTEGSMGRDLENRRLIDWVRETAESARYVMSLCDGAFVLAEAGLLHGRSATTFPGDYEAFAARFPKVKLRVNVSFVHDGALLTSQGGAKSYDVAMYLVDLLYGEEVASGVGRGLLLPWPVDPAAAPHMVTDPGARSRQEREAGPAEGAEDPEGEPPP
jgi:transcriptional regulator GlxA family with amidase domain